MSSCSTARTNDPIYRVSAAGGTPVAAVKAEASRKETEVGWPEFLPDGRHFLYMANGQKAEDNAYRIGSLDSTESKALAPAQTLVTYAPPGYLLFVRDKTLVAQPFDAKALKTTGEPIPLAEHIGTDSVGLARFSVSRDGTLAYRTGESGNRFLWVDRSGKEGETVGDPGENRNPAFAPGGDRLAFDLADPRSGKTDIWVRDLKRGVSSRFTFGAGDAFCPLWSPDGRRIVFTVGADLFEKAVEGQGEEKLLLKSDELKFACDWTRDGRYIAFSSRGKETSWDIWVLPMFGDRKPIAVPEDPVCGADARFLARRPLSGVPVERVRACRDLRPELPRPGRQVADLHLGRRRAAVARRRQGAVLPRSRPEADGGRHSDRKRHDGRHPAAALPGTLRHGEPSATVSSRLPTGGAFSPSPRSVARR